MSTRSNPCPRDQRSTHSHLHPSLLSHAQLLPSSDSSSNSNSNSSSRNARTTQRDDSPSSERFHEPITSHECDSDSDSDSSTGNTARRIDRMGGLGRATEEMFINGPARRAGGAQVEMAGQAAETRHRRRWTVGSHPGDHDGRCTHMDDDERLEGEEGRGRDPSQWRRRCENPDGSSAFSSSDADGPTAPRDYEGRARGEDCDEGPSTPRGYDHGRDMSGRRDEDDDDYEGPPTPRGYGRGVNAP